MLRKTAALLLVSLFILSSSAYAAAWVYFQRLEGTRYGACTEYLDTDSVVKDNDKVTYWTIWVFDRKSQFHDMRKILWKKEAPLAVPPRHRSLEMYGYNGEDVEIRRHLFESMSFYSAPPDEIRRLLPYAKAGTGSDALKPDHTTTPTPRWYGAEEFEDCSLYWDINSIVVWPRDNPATVEIIVKWVWNQKGLEQRKAFLMAQRSHREGYDDLRYTLVNYQFLTTQNKMRILSVADHNDNHERVSFFEGDEWQDIEKGSRDDRARQIALNWIYDSQGSSGK